MPRCDATTSVPICAIRHCLFGRTLSYLRLCCFNTATRVQQCTALGFRHSCESPTD